MSQSTDTQTNTGPKNPEAFLNKERDQTDESLFAERGKTDDSFLDLRKKAEQDTDARVKNDRHQADNTRIQGRNHRDQRHPLSSKLEDHRILEDKTTETERAKIDDAIKAERIIKDKALAEFIQGERQETDENLSHERKQTDKAVLNSTNQLNDEVILHTKTKAELTTRDELLAIVSHDLRNPIGSVLSCADMLLEDPSYSAMGTDLKYWIELIKRNAETSLRLISDILDMERMAEGKLELVLRTQDLSEVVHEALEPFVHMAAANRILLRSRPAEKKILLKFDHDRILQVLSNLIGNALKFTPHGGSILVSVQQTEKGSVVSVQDTGPGIPEDQKEKIFIRYAQIGKKERRGLGLGLYISKTLIEAHGGRIWVTTPAEGGSLFHFSLPH